MPINWILGHKPQQMCFGKLQRKYQGTCRALRILCWYSGDSTFLTLLDQYFDADYAGCQDDRKSTSSYIFMMARGVVTCEKVSNRHLQLPRL